MGGSCDEVTFVLPHGQGAVRLARELATLERLQALLQIDDLVLADPSGEELRANKNGLYALEGDTFYAASESELLREDDDFQGPSQEDPAALTVKFRNMKLARMQMISELYQPLHHSLYSLSEDMFCEDFLAALRGAPDALEAHLTKISDTGLYTFPMFRPQFCKMFIEEIKHFQGSGLPVTRPNSMNRYGLVLDEIGFSPMLNNLLLQYVKPLATLLFPHYHGAELNSHHGFIVQYDMDGDQSLNFHFDDSDVTLNVCLGEEFEGGNLFFSGILEEQSTHGEYVEVGHTPGTALLHAGHHRHGALPITAGTRYNLIMWCSHHATGCRGCHCHR